MSGPAAARDPILDETEEDWVDTKILGGWSHGYLQVSPALTIFFATAAHRSSARR